MSYIIIGRDGCKFCNQAIELLQAKGETFAYWNITNADQELKETLKELTKMKTVPMVLQLIGGFTELKELLKDKTIVYN